MSILGKSAINLRPSSPYFGKIRGKIEENLRQILEKSFSFSFENER